MFRPQAALDPVRELRALIHGYTISQAIYVGAKLGIADQLADEDALYRLLRALAAVGVLIEEDARWFRLTEMGKLLRSNAPSSIRSEALLFGQGPYRALGDLLHSVRTGEPAFDRIYNMSCCTYLAQDAKAGHTFNAAMTQMTSIMCKEVAAHYDFAPLTKIVDVGGGYGVLLARVLAKHKHLRGVIYDFPYVLAGAGQVLESAGVADRVEICAGDAFETIPAGADAYLLKNIVHGWDDARATRILENCRRAIKPNGRLLLIERVIPPGNGPFWGKFVDLVLLAISGGRERTAPEYRALLANAGFALSQILPLPSGFAIVEAVPTEK